MDVEKTLHAILEIQRRAAERADRADQRADRADQRADRADKRMEKFDKQLQATANLVRQGVKLFLDTRKETNFKLNALIDSQLRTDAVIKRNEEAMKKTDEKFNRLLEQLMRKNSNGHN